MVNRNIPEWSVAAGNPCRVIRQITEADRSKYYDGREIDSEAWQSILSMQEQAKDEGKFPVRK